MNTFTKILCLLVCLGLFSACEKEAQKTAMIDIEAVINNGPHAVEAAKQLQEAQKIYQYNLDIIDQKLNTYQNKEQAQAYLIEAARQLQTQLNNSKILVTQSLLNAFNEILEEQKQVYDLIIKKDAILYIKEGDGEVSSKFAAMPEDITVKMQALYSKVIVTYPPLPNAIEEPNLPADLGDAPFPPVSE